MIYLGPGVLEVFPLLWCLLLFLNKINLIHKKCVYDIEKINGEFLAIKM